MFREPGRPERLSASVRKLRSIVGRSPDLKDCASLREVVNRKPHHSGATARDSHPFPYSPHLLGHPDAFKYKEQLLIDADIITRLMRVSNSISIGSLRFVVTQTVSLRMIRKVLNPRRKLTVCVTIVLQ
jgi:hypothetical protein